MENNRCSKCRYLDRYYTKGVNRFNRTDFGYCMHKHMGVNIKEGGCEGYKVCKRTKVVGKRVKQCLNDLLTEITEIRKVIEEEADGTEQGE